MPSPVAVNPEESPYARFAYEMRRHRLEAGWTQLNLARKLSVSVSLVGMVETVRRRPDQRFADACDKAFKLEGIFRDLWKATKWETAPEHFRDFQVAEAQAATLRMWDPMLIPGLFQTESYARRIFEDEPGITPEQVEERVAQRMQRQATLAMRDGPMVWSIIDEGVLHRPLGDAQVMREQFERLVQIATHPRLTIQIIPRAAWSAVGLQSTFLIAEIGGAPFSVYVESAPRGRTIGDREIITALIGRYDALRAVALSRSQSLGLIKEVMAQWI